MKQSKVIRREEAEVRDEACKKLTVEQRIAKLDKVLGVGVGAKKERARLAKQLEAKKSEVK